MDDFVYLFIIVAGIALFFIYLLYSLINYHKYIQSEYEMYEKNKQHFEQTLRFNLNKENFDKEANKYKNKNVLGVLNRSVDNLVIGTCKAYNNKEIIVFDYLKNEDVYFKGKLFIFSDELLSGLCKMNNLERLGMLENKNSFQENGMEKAGNYSKYEVKAILEQNGFYKNEEE